MSLSDSDKAIYEIFDDGGLLSSKIGGYEYRENQLLMALDVMRIFSSPCCGAIEAGTGIGKSFAYLAPTMLKAFDDPDCRTVIATSTINLQRQLIDKDIPALFNAFGKKCSVAIAVGRNNYICLRRLDLEISKAPLMASDSEFVLNKLKSFANSSATGLRTELTFRLDPQIWLDVCSDSDYCIGGKCPFFQQCFYFRAKRKQNSSSIIICNHHLLFLDSYTRYLNMISYEDDCILPPYQYLVVDEAHNMEHHATDLFTKDYSSYAYRHFSDRIYDPKLRSAGQIRILEELSVLCSDNKLYNSILESLALVNQQTDVLNNALMSILDYNRTTHILLTCENVQRILTDVFPLMDSVYNNSGTLITELRDFINKIEVHTDYEDRIRELDAYVTRLAAISDVLDEFRHPDKWNEDVHFLDIIRYRQASYAVMKIAPLSVADLLRKALFESVPSVLCTSATLDLNDNFDFWSKSVGLPCEKKQYIRHVYNSPFDYKNRLMLLTPFDSPDYSHDKTDEYTDFLCSAIGSSVISAGGGTLVLFTNKALMDKCYLMLKPVFDRENLECMRQGDADRYILLESFKQKTDSILFATDSFWEGVDAPGNTLRLVIITKLPFRTPEEPVFRARTKKLEAEGRSAFFELSLPDATMKLKQGFGRLMRHTSDKGIVLILDNRVVKKNYGAMMLSRLPESYHPESRTDNLCHKIENFLYG